MQSVTENVHFHMWKLLEASGFLASGGFVGGGGGLHENILSHWTSSLNIIFLRVKTQRKAGVAQTNYSEISEKAKDDNYRDISAVWICQKPAL